MEPQRRHSFDEGRRTAPDAGPPRFDFDAIRTAINRWRADHAPLLSRDEVVRHVLGQWLEGEGYLQPKAEESPVGHWVVAVVCRRDLSGR